MTVNRYSVTLEPFKRFSLKPKPISVYIQNNLKHAVNNNVFFSSLSITFYQCKDLLMEGIIAESTDNKDGMETKEETEAETGKEDGWYMRTNL